MTYGQFCAGRNESIALLKKLDMVDEIELYPDYRTCKKEELKKMSHKDIWDYLYAKKCYDILLYDNSFMQFQYNSASSSFSYHYVECPYVLVPSWDDYYKKACYEAQKNLMSIWFFKNMIY